MKLYYIPGACSLAARIAIIEANLSTTYQIVEMKPTGNTINDEDYGAINPLGLVPTIVDGDNTIAEAAIVLQYIAEKAGGKLGDVTGPGRWKLLETLNFLATEVHKSFSPLFSPDLPKEAQPFLTKHLARCLSATQDRIGRSGYLVGSAYTVADAYLFTLLGWARFLKIDLSPWPQLVEYAQRIGSRPAVQEALKEEGLV